MLFRSVVEAFTDADGDLHPIGEAWTFEGLWFNKFNNEVTVFVTPSGGPSQTIPLLWMPDRQQDVIQHFDTYLQPSHS